MVKTYRSLLAAALTPIVLTVVASNTAQAFPVVTVNVSGSSYDITYFMGNYNDNTAEFAIPPAGRMPWWGDATLAQSFATQVSDKLGFPYIGLGGPSFAYELRIGNPLVPSTQVLGFAVSNTSPTVASGTAVPPNGARGYAIVNPALPPPAPVPGPLPLFGAAAAFGMSRRLRRRIQLRG